jgi:hypothetical protein
MGYYLTACICLNGHVVTDSVERGFATPFCSACGEETVRECDKCNAPIRGDYFVEGVISLGSGYAPAKPYCHNCGGPYPWTRRKLDGISELAEAIEELTDNERALLAELMPHLIEETPRTPAAGLKIAAVIQRIKGPAKKVLGDAIISIAVDAGKRAIGLG